MHLDVPHNLDEAGARAAVEKAFDHYRTKYASYQPKLRWLDHERAEVTFTAKGITLHGTLALHPGKVVMDAKVPFLLKPFTKRAVAAVESEIHKWLGA
jgi:Putative polyhydroxyalkanoic acid system protein (PHA_gran_rgn)